MKRLPVVAMLFLLPLGCGSPASGPFKSEVAVTGGEIRLGVANATISREKLAAIESQQALVAAKSAAGPALVERKIIYTGRLELIVDNLSKATGQLDDLIKRHQGLLAQSEVNTNAGAPRFAEWRVRVPVTQFSDFVRDVAQIGEVTNNKTDSDDITDKYFDHQVRIENKKIQVDRLQKIIKEQAGRISELLEAERELGRVTTELEQLKGAVKLWDNQIALTTVTVTLHERAQYVASAPATFGKNISRTFWSSLEGFLIFLQCVVLVAVALTPWLPVIALVIAGFWFLLRHITRRPVVARTGVLAADTGFRDGGRGAPGP